MMRQPLDGVSEQELADALRAFDARYGEMERVLWRLAGHSRAALLDGHGDAPILEALIWTIKSWWGVQGVRRETKSAMASALATMDWSPGLFEPIDSPPTGSEDHAVELVATLVRGTMALGVERREFSLASKVLHWLLPWRVPVYDSFVRESVGVPGSWDHPEAYALIAKELFEAARQRSAADSAWMGSFEPRSPLRAFDKWFWWAGGGNVNTAVQVRDPWRVVYELGLDCL